MKLMTFCMFYVIIFSIIIGVTPWGTFPPAPMTYNIPDTNLISYLGLSSITLDWPTLMVTIIAMAIAVAVITNLVNVNIFGSGLNIDAKYITKMAIGIALGGVIGITLNMMLANPTLQMPIIFQLICSWPFAILLIYSIIAEV